MLIDHKANHVYVVEDFSFMPGVNSLTKVQWDKLKKHEHVKYRLDNDLMKVISDDASEAEGGHSLAKFDIVKSTKLIEETYDLDLLNAWQEDEKRKNVKAVVTAQLKKIMGPAFDKNEVDTEPKHFKS